MISFLRIVTDWYAAVPNLSAEPVPAVTADRPPDRKEDAPSASDASGAGSQYTGTLRASRAAATSSSSANTM